MFPLNSNDQYIDENGKRSTLGSKLEGETYQLPTASSNVKGGIKVGDSLEMTGDVLNAKSQIPSHTSSESGKFLSVNSEGSLIWTNAGGLDNTGVYKDLVLGRPIFKPSTTPNKYNIAMSHNGVNQNPGTITLGLTDYDLADVFLPQTFPISELYYPLTSGIISDLELVELTSQLTGVTEVTLTDPITDFEIIAIQGCYDSTGQNTTYDSTIFYNNPALNTPYWFGVHDRNASYSGLINFDTTTHGVITAASSRRLKIFGIS